LHQRYGHVVSPPREHRREDFDRREQAVAQHHGRGRPALDLATAPAELAQLVQRGEIERGAPGCTRTAAVKQFQLLIADAFAPPLAAQNGGWVSARSLLTTILTGRPRDDRARRKSRRASAQRARRRASW
jgi:hypothetical protein